jgi:hypothetical protein
MGTPRSPLLFRLAAQKAARDSERKDDTNKTPTSSVVARLQAKRGAP